jgi:hypothetical protein
MTAPTAPRMIWDGRRGVESWFAVGKLGMYLLDVNLLVALLLLHIGGYRKDKVEGHADGSEDGGSQHRHAYVVPA